MSSWTRAIVDFAGHRSRARSEAPGAGRLQSGRDFHSRQEHGFESDDSWLSWRKTFIQSDKILKLWERYGFARIRKAAMRKCEHWMLERMKHADGLGAIYPPMQYSIMALDVLGYPAGPSGARRSHSAVRKPDGG